MHAEEMVLTTHTEKWPQNFHCYYHLAILESEQIFYTEFHLNAKDWKREVGAENVKVKLWEQTSELH